MYEYRGTLERAIDGDTIQVTIDLGFYIKVHSVRLRLHGVDTEEMTDPNPHRRERAVEARDLLTGLLYGKELTIRTYVRSSGAYLKTFDRYVADVLYPKEPDGVLEFEDALTGQLPLRNVADDIIEMGLEKLPRIGGAE